MPSNYKFYNRSAEYIQSIRLGGFKIQIRELNEELYEKLMEAEVVLKELQANRRRRWLKKAD